MQENGNPSNSSGECTVPVQGEMIANYEYRIKALMDEGMRDKARVRELEIEIEELEIKHSTRDFVTVFTGSL